jgi:hypothetical protein
MTLPTKLRGSEIRIKKKVTKITAAREAGMAQSVYTLGYGLNDWSSILGSVIDGIYFSLCHGVQTGSGAHPASYPTGTEGPYLEGKAAGV